MKTKLLIFGITGDLSTRKLLPALNQIIQISEFNDIEIIGVSRHEVNVTELLQSSPGNTSLASKLSVFSMDLAEMDEYLRLIEFIKLQDDEHLLVYLSVPPNPATQIADFLGEAGLCTPNVKLLFEKPFGIDYASATDVITRTSRYYNEDQIYRIDHYLAKEMAQNIVAFRGQNALFGHLWNNNAIEKIEVVAFEKIGIEGRVQFYDQTGALRDVVQGHLMQLLALTLMDIPPQFKWDIVPDMRLAALEQLHLERPDSVMRAQYEGYQQEVNNPSSLTETFVALTLTSSTSQWQGVPLVLIAGKAMNQKTTEIRIHFRKFHDAQSNCLVFRVQPNEGIEIELFVKKPGYERSFEIQKLGFNYPEDTILPDAYEQVLVDAIRSHKSLFTTSQEVLRSWQILQPLLDQWGMDKKPLIMYAKGSNVQAIGSV